MQQPRPPAWKKVIFVDWHGVLSCDPFWLSIIRNQHHPLHHRLSAATEMLFQDEARIHDWMRGDITADQIVHSLQVTFDDAFPSDYLSRRLVEDCRLMLVNHQLVQLLRDVQKQGVAVVLATDNMDCFFKSLQRARQLSIQSGDVNNETTPFISTARMFDDVLCSSRQRVLKREDPQRFYGGWIRTHALDFSKILLLDDLEINCAAFRSTGGTAIRVQKNGSIEQVGVIRTQITQWLQTTASAIP